MQKQSFIYKTNARLFLLYTSHKGVKRGIGKEIFNKYLYNRFYLGFTNTQ